MLMIHWHIEAETKWLSFSNSFSWDIQISKISLNFVPEVQIDNMLTLVRIMAWRRTGPSHYLNQWWHMLPTHICVNRPQWVQYTGNTTCCIRHPTHRLNCVCRKYINFVTRPCCNSLHIEYIISSTPDSLLTYFVLNFVFDTHTRPGTRRTSCIKTFPVS